MFKSPFTSNAQKCVLTVATKRFINTRKNLRAVVSYAEIKVWPTSSPSLFLKVTRSTRLITSQKLGVEFLSQLPQFLRAIISSRTSQSAENIILYKTECSKGGLPRM